MRHRLFAAPKVFSPFDLGSSLLAWWSADHTSCLTISGGTVSSWRDGRFGYDGVQADGTRQPIYSATSFNGAPGLTFDGTDDRLIVASQPASFPTGANPCEIWAIVSQDALPADGITARRIFQYGGTANERRSLDRTISGGVNRAQLVTGSGAATIPALNTGVDLSSRHLVRAVVTATTGGTGVDGSAVTTAAVVPATGSGSAVGIGSTVGGAGTWHGSMRDIVVTLPLTSDQESKMQAWGLPRRMV